MVLQFKQTSLQASICAILILSVLAIAIEGCRSTREKIEEPECEIPDCKKFGGECKLVDSKPTCQCQQLCTREYDLRCDIYGVEYGNECRHRIEECKQKKSIPIANYGRCKRKKTHRLGCLLHNRNKPTVSSLLINTSPIPSEDEKSDDVDKSCKNCKFGGRCEVVDGKAKCKCPTVRRYDHPVCGSDGRSYSNEDELQNARCDQQKQITVIHDGRCKKKGFYKTNDY